MTEPRYTSADPFEDEFNPRIRAKWSKAKTPYERLILRSVNRHYFKSQEEAAALRILVRGLYGRAMLEHLDKKAVEDWIEDRCEVAGIMRSKGKMVQLKGLMTMLWDKERWREFQDKWGGGNKTRTYADED